jgi:hypothetical protein
MSEKKNVTVPVGGGLGAPAVIDIAVMIAPGGRASRRPLETADPSRSLSHRVWGLPQAADMC